MPEKHLYEYAIVRLTPRVERGEFINVGVVLYCKSLKFLSFKFELNQTRIEALCSTIDINEVASNLKAFSQICLGKDDSGLIGQQDVASRFRWLTAKRSTIIQASEVHPGYCQNPEETLNTLLIKMVK